MHCFNQRAELRLNIFIFLLFKNCIFWDTQQFKNILSMIKKYLILFIIEVHFKIVVKLEYIIIEFYFFADK
ncbi:Uncharacterised protein [Mycobacterium tuberculosis]|nr:Uncharacterised protein [Mycobacterium tuberculosis]